jgi:hypothetical protein
VNVGMIWKFLRLSVIAITMAGLLSFDEPRSNLDWGVGFLAGIVFSISLYWWLAVVRSRHYADRQTEWSQPYSFDRPFFPMRKYPLRFWFLAAYSLMIAGAAVMLRDMIENAGNEGFGGSFFIAGLFMTAALVLWVKRFSQATA